jgi:hypothetical protein
VRLLGSFGLAQRIVTVLGLGAAFVALGSFLDTVGYDSVTFGWFAYAPLNTSTTAPFHPQPAWAHLAIWAGVSVLWALAALWIIGSALGRRIVLVLALAGVLIALGRYLPTLGSVPQRPGLQFLSSEQRWQYGSVEPWAQFLIWLGLVAVWTTGSFLLLRPRHTLAPSDEHPQHPYPSSPQI